MKAQKFRAHPMGCLIEADVAAGHCGEIQVFENATIASNVKTIHGALFLGTLTCLGKPTFYWCFFASTLQADLGNLGVMHKCKKLDETKEERIGRRNAVYELLTRVSLHANISILDSPKPSRAPASLPPYKRRRINFDYLATTALSPAAQSPAAQVTLSPEVPLAAQLDDDIFEVIPNTPPS